MIIQGDLFTSLAQNVLNKAKSLLKSENEAMLSHPFQCTLYMYGRAEGSEDRI